MSKSKEKIDYSKKFYDDFQLGIELEMEIKMPHALNNVSNLFWKEDGSLRRTKEDTILRELISKKPFKKEEEEDSFIEAMKEQIIPFKSSDNTEVFAYKNNSCGTHIHFSFKNQPQSHLWLFDCLDFERTFFKKYMDYFRSDKFLKRINADYCKAPSINSVNMSGIVDPSAVKSDLKKMNILDFNSEKNKLCGNTRYRWLNMEAIQRNTGAEIRVYPHIQTYKGIKIVTDFTKSVIAEWYAKPETQSKLALIKFYEERVKEAKIDESKLSEINKVVYAALKLTSNDNSYSGEVRSLLARWVMKKPSIINNHNTESI